MVEPAQAASQVAAALRMAEDPNASPQERAEMLMEIAMGLQSKPKSASQLHDAVKLYQRALREVPPAATLLKARIQARMGTAFAALPDGGAKALEEACACFEAAQRVLGEQGMPEELAETELNLGLALQSLASQGRRRVQDAIRCYHRALRVFKRETHPREFAILHNNLAIAYLSIPATDERAKMREALAVQSFEEVLKVVNLIDHPSEYAMVQNNLGNALQYAPSGHRLENNLRALTAYDEALKVRNPRTTPVEYANTIANKANVLRNLPPGIDIDGVADPLSKALELYREAQTLYAAQGLNDRVELLASTIEELERDVTARRQRGNGHGSPAVAVTQPGQE